MQLTVRVEPHTWDYIEALVMRSRDETGVRISMGQVAATLLERAEIEGWTVTAPRPHTSPPAAPFPPQAGGDSNPHTEG